MNPRDYQLWMEKAFLYIEAALGQELATPSRICMTEEYFRSAFVRGLAASRPDLADRVRTEENASWSTNGCWKCQTTDGQRRPLQHDVAVVPNDDDAGMLCEVKWVKTASASAIARDVWKLLLSRGTAAEQQATRTYLLLGGEAKPLSDTLESLRDNHLNLRWSNAGGGSGTVRATRDFSATSFLGSTLGSRDLDYILGWGSNPRHRRDPPATWASWRISRRFSPWLRTIEGTGWRAVMFEIHHHGASNNSRLNLGNFKNSLTFVC